MLKRSHRARTDPRKEAYVSVYYKAQMLPQDRFHTLSLSDPRPPHCTKWDTK